MHAAGELYEVLVPAYHLRHTVKPGLTGLAQANGLRGPTVNADLALARVRADLAYIDKMNLWLDIKIIWKTFIQEVRSGSGF
jgi:lipopolysaccharide/colanic/teichoic acid biosynthesis glycosyltransferase